MDRRRYLATVATTTALGLAGCGGSSNDTDTSGSQLRGPTQEGEQQVDLQYREWTDAEIDTVREEAEEVEYDELARNAEDMAGDYVTATTVVIQNLEGPNADYTALLLGYDRSGSSNVYGSWLGDRFLQGDVIQYWGEVLGTETYQSAQYGQQTVPAVAIADAELQNTDS